MARVLIVSNRSPITVKVEDGQLHAERSAGGLATGLQGPHERSGGLWIGWPGDTGGLDASQRAALDARLAELRIVPVDLSPEEIESYYEGLCNGIVWPLFHYFIGQLPLDLGDFEVYERVNERFADAIAAHHQPGDMVWVQDYHLMRVPALLRQRIPDARIGFFLHIPFPSSELFRALPWREAILEGLLGADLIGFHTATYMRHFASCAIRVLGASTDIDGVVWAGRRTRIGVFPMGVDAASFAATAEDPDVAAEVAALRGDGEVKLLVGIDRLDYTKGIPRRLLAFEQLLRDHPDLRERVRLVQVAVPSRMGVDAYQDFREQVDGLIGRIHGAFATARWAPIHYLFRNLAPREVVALYRAADVMLVTPIRDGMNLVAKEFVASRTDEGGALVLSEFAGAANELAEALHVNPYDIRQSAQAYHRALSMPDAEQRTRMQALRRRVFVYDVHRWARIFLDRLEASPVTGEGPDLTVSSPGVVREVIDRLRGAPHLVLLLDYDGTLVPFAPTPDLAAPDDALLALLQDLARRPRTDVHVISGRRPDTLERWLGALPIGLHAEHGVWSRVPGSREWAAVDQPPQGWREGALAILEDFAGRTPGALVEEKSAGLAWHFRMADPEFGPFQANELRLHLTATLSNEPVEILPGDKVIELRPHGHHKGRLVEPIAAAAPAGALIAAIGDDRTDEDLFGALPEGAIAIHAGPRASAAPIRLAGVPAVRALLRRLLEEPGDGRPAP